MTKSATSIKVENNFQALIALAQDTIKGVSNVNIAELQNENGKKLSEAFKDMTLAVSFF